MKLQLFLVLLSLAFVYGREKPAQCKKPPQPVPQSFQSTRHRRIAGGEPAQTGAFKWHVHMVLDDDLGLKMCGGALINPKWVLTSGWCLVCTSAAMLYFGVTDRLDFNVPWMTSVTDYNHFVIHEDYELFSETPLDENIGLVFLKNGGDFLLTLPNVGVVELPVGQADNLFLGSHGTAIGFGSTEDPQKSSSQFLRFVSMPIITKDACNELFETDADVIGDNKLCTSTAGGKSTCHGDFGGPLTTKVDNKDVLIGIGSLRNNEGCQIGAPAVFTRVTKYLDWIETNTSREPSTTIDCKCDCVCHTCPSETTSRVEL